MEQVKIGDTVTTLPVKVDSPTPSVVTIDLSDDVKALLQPKAVEPDEPFLEVDFDPVEMRLEMADPEPDPTLDIDADQLRDLIRDAVLAGVREKVQDVALREVNALRGRVD
jgi:hypothetical protein